MSYCEDDVSDIIFVSDYWLGSFQCFYVASLGLWKFVQFGEI